MRKQKVGVDACDLAIIAVSRHWGLLQEHRRIREYCAVQLLSVDHPERVQVPSVASPEAARSFLARKRCRS